MTLTFRFQGQICNLSYLNPKWCDCHEIKANIAIELKACLTIEYDLGHDIERWGVRIYRIVTGVTLDVGVPSTRLVLKSIVDSRHHRHPNETFDSQKATGTEEIWKKISLF